MRMHFTALFLLFCCPAALGQPPGKPPQPIQPTPMFQPGTITVQTIHAQGVNPLTTITATAGGIECVFSDPGYTAISLFCSVAGVQTHLNVDPGFNLRPTEGSLISPIGDSIKWAFVQRTVGVISWSITANGFTRAGTF